MASRPADETLSEVIRGGALCGAMRGDVRSWSRRGGSALRLPVVVSLTLAVVYAASVLLPVAGASFRFSQAMATEASQGPVNEPATFIHDRLLVEAKRLGLDIPARQIVVKKDGPELAIDADYVVPVDIFGGISFDWRFQPHRAGTRRPDAIDSSGTVH